LATRWSRATCSQRSLTPGGYAIDRPVSHPLLARTAPRPARNARRPQRRERSRGVLPTRRPQIGPFHSISVIHHRADRLLARTPDLVRPLGKPATLRAAVAQTQRRNGRMLSPPALRIGVALERAGDGTGHCQRQRLHVAERTRGAAWGYVGYEDTLKLRQATVKAHGS
jgi:hypothetical protein